MKPFMGYLICSDIDGTLTTYHDVISPENIKAIKYFQENGGCFTVATGRSPSYIDMFKGEFVPNVPVISFNGTVLYDYNSKKVVKQHILNKDFVKVIEYITDKLNMIQKFGCYSLNKSIEFTPSEFKEYIDELSSQDWNKFILFFERSEDAIFVRDDLIKNFNEHYTIERSWDFGVEVHPKGSGKGECIEELKNSLDIDIHTVIAIGDYENDISMIEKADIGYAPENADANVKNIADKVVPSNHDNAVAYVINNLLKR